MTRGGITGWRIAGWGFALALLFTPLIAMQFTTEVRWGGLDFLVAALLIGGLGLAIEVAVRRSLDLAYRAGALTALLTAFALIWINLAVGFIGDERNPANLLFGVVLLVALVGGLAARFRPRGMAVAMGATAIAQLLIAVIAFVAALASGLENGLIIVFAAPWALSAALFDRAARS